MIDKTYLAELGVTGVGDTAQVGASRVRIAGLTEGIRSFTVTPYVFTTLNRARSLIDMPADKITYVLVKLAPGADPEAVRTQISRKVPDSEVLTRAEFRQRSLNHWLFATGAGVALIGGAILGLVVGTVIVAQTLYSSTKDHLNEFATLRALGSSGGYIHRVILAQAGLSAVLGYVLGMTIALTIVLLSEHTALPIVMTPALAALLLALTDRHVRDFGALGDRQGDEDRSGDGVQPMTAQTAQPSTEPAPTNDVVLEARDIVKELGQGAGKVRALKGVNLGLNTGELTLLMGPSGSGKTTLLSILGCILTPTEGTLLVAGQPTAGLDPEELAALRRRHMGFVFQAYNLFPTLTAEENVRVALDVRRQRGSEAVVRAQRALHQVGLRHKLKSYPANMSGGEQQRVAVARALVGAPSVILADEPTAALDSENGLGGHAAIVGNRQGQEPSRARRHPRPEDHSVRRPGPAHRGRPDRRRGAPRGRRGDGSRAGAQQKAKSQCVSATPV